ncbi:MAG: hypothetical protein A2Z99_13485 [Treponema sp. GWB1_62_6]|nr:MAG: hypothetical protein A2001_19645 [Treponema sp. GWC1_61_84]OHE70021.1 MAG: hypothetical protein A2Z99_13485 [Treponema sp. GWB1_62_6]
MAEKNLRSLDYVLPRLIFIRFYIPMLVLGSLSVASMFFLSTSYLASHQSQVTRGLAQAVEYHVDQAERILDALAQSIGRVDPEVASVFIKSTWSAYGYFETLYYLDRENRVSVLMPDDRRLSGLDLSNVPVIRDLEKNAIRAISRPYISVRTGEPTVLVVRAIPEGGRLVGELRLGLFQMEIDNAKTQSKIDFLLLADQQGTLLAHPDIEQVRQQVNISQLDILKKERRGRLTWYEYDGVRYIGSARWIEKTGWVVIDQISVKDFSGSYVMILFLILSVSFIIWFLLWWVLRRLLRRQVVRPLEALGNWATELATGRFDLEEKKDLPATHLQELDRLSSDFNIMRLSLLERDEALKEAHAGLEQKVEQRTAELGNKTHEVEVAYHQLREAQFRIIQQEKMASVGQLAAGVAHEINNPLAFMISNINYLHTAFGALAKGQPQETEVNEIFKETLIGATRIKTIISELMTFSRSSNENESVNVNQSLKNILNIIHNQIRHRIVIKTDLGDVPPLDANPSQLNQVFMNLLLNAMQAIPETGEIFISTWVETGQVHVRFADTGIGIAPENLGRIFEPFFSTKVVGQGQGLGLSVAYEIIKNHGGSIDVQSEPGQGATFTIRIPLTEEGRSAPEKGE